MRPPVPHDPVPRARHALSVAGVFALGIFMTGWLARWLAGAVGPWPFLAVGYVTVALTHELGHAVAGLLTDFRVSCLLMGPLKVEWPKRGSLAVRINKRPSLWGGAVGVAPRSHPSLDRLGAFRKRMIFVLAGGPAASVLAGLAALIVSVIFRQSAPQPFGDGLSWLQFLALASVGTGFGQAVPIRLGSQRSDGLRVLRMLRAKRGHEQALVEAIVVANMDGVRPRDWPIPAQGPDASIQDLPTLMMIYYGLMDQGRHAEAWDLLDLPVAGAEGRSGGWDAMRDLERTYMRAVHRMDDTAPLAGTEIPESHREIPPLSLLRARAAVMVARGEVEEAMRCADSLRSLRTSSGSSGLAQFNLAELDRILASARC